MWIYGPTALWFIRFDQSTNQHWTITIAWSYSQLHLVLLPSTDILPLYLAHSPLAYVIDIGFSSLVNYRTQWGTSQSEKHYLFDTSEPAEPVVARPAFTSVIHLESSVGKFLPLQSFRHLQICQTEHHKTVQADREMSQICDYSMSKSGNK